MFVCSPHFFCTYAHIANSLGFTWLFCFVAPPTAFFMTERPEHELIALLSFKVLHTPLGLSTRVSITKHQTITPQACSQLNICFPFVNHKQFGDTLNYPSWHYIKSPIYINIINSSCFLGTTTNNIPLCMVATTSMRTICAALTNQFFLFV